MVDRLIIIAGFVLMLGGLIWLGLMNQSLGRMLLQLGDLIVLTHQ